MKDTCKKSQDHYVCLLNTGSDNAETISASAVGNSTYDFKGESPCHGVENKLKKRPTKNAGEKQKPTTGINAKSVSEPTKTQTETRKGKINSLSKVTPKINQPSSKCRSRQNEVVTSALAKQRSNKFVKPIPPPNLDDISPVVKDTKQSKGRSKNEKPVPEKRRLRSSDFAQESPIVSNTSKNNDNDSAIFLSPRIPTSQLCAEKTSTPVSVTVKKTAKQVNKVLKSKLENTSTPNDKCRPTKTFSRIKDKLPAVGLSPVETVERTETPTSDYASMDCIVTPSPVQSSTQRRKREHSPAFTLDDETEHSECLELNKSVDKMYKKSKKKYDHHPKRSESKLNEWAEKMNSELEDIENFELSVEG
ncbi:uncharacterized protein LOC127871843 isoform X2 [Dreissena polymorpha]|uniref:uncharacterized protein LOC127871843 isoform X2 n=1 Tax=Dreissena polymorpha TaxID=45954 RepID=UPI00226493A6|nr:uncharacterized protein LOC127871843 isoform X2 [Dreissena polymorpha]